MSGARIAVAGALGCFGFLLCGSALAQRAQPAEVPTEATTASEATTGDALVGSDMAPTERDFAQYPPPSTRFKLGLGGLITTGFFYGAGATCAAIWPDAPGADELMVPVAGPWMALAANGCAADDPDCGFSKYLRGFLTVIDGLGQAGGVGMLVEAIVMKTEAKAVRGGADAVPSDRSHDVAVWRAMPVVAPGRAGVAVVGSF